MAASKACVTSCHVFLVPDKTEFWMLVSYGGALRNTHSLFDQQLVIDRGPAQCLCLAGARSVCPAKPVMMCESIGMNSYAKPPRTLQVATSANWVLSSTQLTHATPELPGFMALGSWIGTLPPGTKTGCTSQKSRVSSYAIT